jgi:hypothetical protein
VKPITKTRMRRGGGGGATEEDGPGAATYWLGKIVDTLVVAGYFRARLKGLDAFDKVVGGMVWCVTQAAYAADNVIVDVDIIFVENASIGAKM